MTETNKLKGKLLSRKAPETMPDWGVSTGSTLLNLACTGRPDVGMLARRYYLWVGDPGSGKTFITLTTLAEAADNPLFDKYRLVFHNAEEGAQMDFERFFGKKMANRLVPPVGSWDKPIHPTCLEDFYDCLSDNLSAGPCIYLLDSMDVLVPRAWLKKIAKDRRATEKGKEAGGSYGTEKARINSDRLRQMPSLLKAHDSIVIVISQSRENIGFDAMFNPKTRGGGKAMTFYSSLELWTRVQGHYKKKVGEYQLEQGVKCGVRVKRNRITGRDRSVEVPVFHSYGIDDLGGMVDWLVDVDHWKKSVGRIEAMEFGMDKSKEELIRFIEEGKKQKALRLVVADKWQEIEESVELKRERRYE